MRGRSSPSARTLHAIHDWTFLLGPGFADGIGTGLILGWLMYRSGLVSRRMALFGIVGGPLLAASGDRCLFGVIPQVSPAQGIATVPEFIWEPFMGLWFTGVQGPSAAGRPRHDSGADGTYVGNGHPESIAADAPKRRQHDRRSRAGTPASPRVFRSTAGCCTAPTTGSPEPA